MRSQHVYLQEDRASQATSTVASQPVPFRAVPSTRGDMHLLAFKKQACDTFSTPSNTIHISFEDLGLCGHLTLTQQPTH